MLKIDVATADPPFARRRVTACAHPPARAGELRYKGEPVIHLSFAERGSQDLLTAGVGFAGMQGGPPPPADPAKPTALGLRQVEIRFEDAQVRVPE